MSGSPYVCQLPRPELAIARVSESRYQESIFVQAVVDARCEEPDRMSGVLQCFDPFRSHDYTYCSHIGGSACNEQIDCADDGSTGRNIGSRT